MYRVTIKGDLTPVVLMVLYPHTIIIVPSPRVADPPCSADGIAPEEENTSRRLRPCESGPNTQEMATLCTRSHPPYKVWSVAVEPESVVVHCWRFAAPYSTPRAVKRSVVVPVCVGNIREGVCGGPAV